MGFAQRESPHRVACTSRSPSNREEWKGWFALVLKRDFGRFWMPVTPESVEKGCDAIRIKTSAWKDGLSGPRDRIFSGEEQGTV